MSMLPSDAAREPFTIRPALPSELPILNAIDDDASTLYAAYGIPLELPAGHVFLREELARWLRSAELGCAFLAVDAAGTALGFAAVGAADGAPYLEQLAVRVSAMRRGIGGRLLERAADCARAAGATGIWLTTYGHLPFNRPYYLRHGYEVVPEAACGPDIRHHLDQQRRCLPEPTQRVAMRRLF
jgi:GNAT superfamily N-acetyltransferase